MIDTAIILAGGFGTRLQTLVNDVPKPMAVVNGEPFLNHLLNYLKHYGIKKVIFSVGFLADKIQNHYFHKFNGIEIDYVLEKNPMGTGGGIRLAMEHCTEKEVLVLNGDSFFNIDLIDFYKKHQSGLTDFSLALRSVENASRYGNIETDTEQRIVSFKEKSAEAKEGKINAGIYILNTALYLQNTEADLNFSIEKDFFEKNLKSLHIKGFEYDGYFIDIGIPEDYLKAQDDLKGFTFR